MLSTKFWIQKVCWQCSAMFCLYMVPTHNLNFHWRWRWWHWIQTIFLHIFYFTTSYSNESEIPTVNYTMRLKFLWSRTYYVIVIQLRDAFFQKFCLCKQNDYVNFECEFIQTLRTNWQKYQCIEYENDIPWKYAFLARHL